MHVPPNVIRDVQFEDADAVGGGLAPEEEHAPQEEPHTQVQPEHAQDGQLYSIEDEIASEKQQVANAKSDPESVSSHCRFSDPEFMGPNTEFKCIFWKR